MVTGIETAGLVLAVFPLIVTGLQSYADGARTIKDMWRPELALKSLIRDLGMEKCKFENTCTFLLEGMVTDSHLTRLMECPGGSLWSDHDLQKKLENRLRRPTALCYMDAMQELTSTLQILQDKLGIGNDDKPKPDEKRALKKKLNKMLIILSKSENKELLQKIAKINSDLATLTGQSKSASAPLQMTMAAKHYKRIRSHAINLFGVLRERLQAASACACTLPHNATLRLEVRNATVPQRGRSPETGLRFHVVLSFENDPAGETYLPCNWREMGLEPLDGDKEQTSSRNSSDKGVRIDMVPSIATTEKTDSDQIYPTTTNTATNTATKRRIIFRGHSDPSTTGLSERMKTRLDRIFPESFTDLYTGFGKNEPKPPPKVSFSLLPVDCINSPSITPDRLLRNTTDQIEDLCMTIQRAKSGLACLGVLIDGSNRRYRVWPLGTPPPASELTGVLSLESLLTQPGALKKKDRLILGVQLASTVMQLHTTEWLSENWGKKDILFHQEITRGKGGGVVNISPVIRKPLVRRVFAPPAPPSLSPQSTQASTKSIFMPQNQSLYSLGIVLMELWYGQRLEDLRIETDGNGIGDVTNMRDYMTARRLIDEIPEDAGEKYGDAVRRCINGLDHRSSSLEKDDFKNEVHMKVVSPLVENLESFCAMGLVELLQTKNTDACATDENVLD